MKNRPTALPDQELVEQVCRAVMARLAGSEGLPVPSKQLVGRSSRPRDATTSISPPAAQKLPTAFQRAVIVVLADLSLISSVRLRQRES